MGKAEMLRRRLAIFLSMLAVGCSDSDQYPELDAGPDPVYELSFVCLPGGEACPAAQECPELPLGAGGCEDLPGHFGHDPIPAEAGRPLGCRAKLPYGNPYFSNQQQICICDNRAGRQQWTCLL